MVFAASVSVGALFAGMLAFAIGEAFRTGTHKAMIFAWLKQQGRQNEKTEIYGLTRSWSQLGSALSSLIAAGLVFATQSYSAIFWLSIIPTSLNIVNFLGYPKSLDGTSGRSKGVRALLAILRKSFRDCLQTAGLRRLIGESMGFEGMYGASKDYLQPIIHQTALALPLLTLWDATRRTAVVIAVVYTALYLLSSVASRRAGRFAQRLGGDARAARALWIGFGGTFSLLLVGTLSDWTSVAVISFVILAVIQNIWRPILVSRVADQVDDANMATILSVESQAKSLGVAVLAPLIGWCIDIAPAPYQFVPIALAGLLIAATALLRSPPAKTT